MRTFLCCAAVLICACADVEVDSSDGETVARAGGAVVSGASPLAQQAFVKATNDRYISEFGSPIAMDGDTMVAAAPFTDWAYDSDGAAFVFVRDGAGWSQQARLNVPYEETDDGLYFGTSVAIQGDVIVAGAHMQGNGAVHVFERTGTVWTRTAVLRPPFQQADILGEFGIQVAIDGDTLAVGMRGDSSASTGVGGDPTNQDALWSGAVYVYTRDGAGWVLEAYIKPSNTTAEHFFGGSLALSGDTLAVGSSDDSSATGVDGDQTNTDSPLSGAVFVFERGASGWAQQAYVKASNTGPGDVFGRAGGTGRGIDLSGDTLVVGAVGEDGAATGVDGDQTSNDAQDSGAVYVFTRDGTTWSQQAFIKASNTGPGDLFGLRVAVSGDRLAVSAIGEDGGATGIDGDQTSDAAPEAGAVYLFERGGSYGDWTQVHYIKGHNTDTRDAFGFGLELEGPELAVGAIGQYTCPDPDPDPDDLCLREGAVYLFQ